MSILHQRCKALGIPSIVVLRSKGVPYIAHSQLVHIDLCNVYRKVMVKDGIYNSYRTNKLDEVSRALLGHGKYGNYTGEEFKNLPIEEAEKYSLMDSRLVMELSQHNDYEVLDSMLAISDITGINFERVCRTNLTTWWGSIFDNMVSQGLCERPSRYPPSGTYKGAQVLSPKRGFYRNIRVVDGKSLYPSVAIKYNLSFDTINCKCCTNDPEARVNKIFPAEFLKDCKFVNPAVDWICRKRDGAFPTKLKIFKAERLRQKALGNKAQQHALKILINGGYGIFGFSDFSYYDPRVAELVTLAGRYILSEMQESAKYEFGFEIIYGDTDSLFLNNTSDKALKEFQKKFDDKYGIELELKNQYDKLLLSSGKKHYIGYEKGAIDAVGYEGEKCDRCALQQKVFSELLEDIIKHEIDPLPKLRKVFRELDANEIPSELLKIEQRINQPLSEYDLTSRIYKIAMEYDAKQGDLVWFFNADASKVGKSYTRNTSEIDTIHYKGLLFNVVAEILEIAGYDLAKLAEEFGVKIDKNKRYKKKVSKKLKSKSNSPGKIRRPKPTKKPRTEIGTQDSDDNSSQYNQAGAGGDL